MLLRGWIIGWMIQLAVALVLWLPLALFSGWEGSFARAWAIGAKVRTGFWLLLLLVIGGALLVGQVQPGVPVGSNQQASTASGGARSAASLETASDPEIVKVYDYTTTDPWTGLVISTVKEFNAARPPEAPELVYVTAPGDAECLDITNDDVWKLSGIIVCDTTRPEDFPYDPNAPKEGWAGRTSLIDSDTIRIALNGFYFSTEDADNTVCHEMMHAYLRGVEDNYGSDAHSCIFGSMLAPGPTDIRLMQEHWPPRAAEPPQSLTIEEPPRPEHGREAVPDVVIDVPDQVAPTIAPTPTPQRPTATAVPTMSGRSGCDPAYPDERTCIPPGPPLEEPCAITDERNFTVLPPDPRRLDADGNGIGCEPYTP